MISEERVTEWIFAALQEVKASDSSYDGIVFTDETVLVGADSPLDSIAFSYFASALDETIEDETGEEYMLQVDELHQLKGTRGPLQLRDVAQLVALQIGQGGRGTNDPA